MTAGMRVLAVAMLASVAPAPCDAQRPAGSAVASAEAIVTSPESVVVTPGSHYQAGSFARFLFGDTYRTLWMTPIKVPVLSLEHYAGGLQARQRGGSMQTKSLRFAGADGREYVFRSVDKDPAPSLPPELRDSYASRVMQDLISASHPTGGLVVARLLDGAGVLHATPQLVALPNDARLGEFRNDFGGMLGWLELRPTDDAEDGGAGFAGASKVVSSEKLLERLDKHADERPDARAYLTARLFDVFVGDWDRHAEQWRWARFGEGTANLWQPIPRDRDWALVKLDGAVWALARFTYPIPQFVSFTQTSPDIVWLTWTGRLLDRRILSELDKPTWDSVTTALRGRLSDALIDDAVSRIPPELNASRASLAQVLRARRDRLDRYADGFYRLLAREVDLHASDESEAVEIVRVDKRFTDVSVRDLNKSGAPRSRPTVHRRLDADETGEIRIFLRGGDDVVTVRGAPTGRTLVRVVSGGGNSVLRDSTAGGASRVLLYDSTGRMGIGLPKGFSVDRGTYVPPPTRRGWIDPPRDWGTRVRTTPWLGYTPDIGIFLGGGAVLERYGFREDPYASRMSLRAGYGLGAGGFRAEYDAEFRRPNSAVHTTLFAHGSTLEILRFYGFGNETAALDDRQFYRVDQRQWAITPMLHVPLKTEHLTFDAGATLRYASTQENEGRFIALAQPYGVGSFGQVGARAGVTLDTRDVAAYATRGVHISAQGTAYPAIWSAEHGFGDLRSQASAYLTAPHRFKPTLALRVGGDKLWGRYPFFDAAFVGGASTVRGWREQRFAGDASLYGNAELRLFLTKFFLFLPADLGVFGLADAGRVYQSGAHSDVWHPGVGGGIWASFLGRANTMSVSFAHSREGNGVYFRSGLMY